MQDAHRQKLISEWAATSRRLLKRTIPRTKGEAARRFKCNKLSGGSCELKGEHCAKRHLLALATIEKIEKRPDWQCKLTRSDDVTCSNCAAGSARAMLLEISYSGTRARRKNQIEKDETESLIFESDENEFKPYV